MNDYQSTSEFPDAEGKALLSELWSLYGACDSKRENGTFRKVRKGSREQKISRADLECAIIKAGSRFRERKEFTAWLCNNNAEMIEACDPIRTDLENEFYNLKNTVEWLVERVNDSH